MRGSLMRKFSRETHAAILADFPSNVEAAAAYNNILGVTTAVSRQNVKYWREIFQHNEGKLAPTDRALITGRVLRTPQPDDDLGDLSFIPDVAHSILVIGDIHAPYQHPDMVDFLDSVNAHFRPDLHVQIGDELDYHALSFHDSDPNLDSAGTELEKGKLVLRQLHQMFPNMLVCHSNHGSMVYRKAKHTGIPVQMIKRYRDVCFPSSSAPGWSWGYEWMIDTPLGKVLFKHQKSGSLLADAAHQGANLVVGHEHGLFGVEYGASSTRLYWGANTGCLIDKDALAFAYGKHSLKKPIIGCLVVLEGRPFPVPMLLNKEGRWTGKL